MFMVVRGIGRCVCEWSGSGGGEEAGRGGIFGGDGVGVCGGAVFGGGVELFGGDVLVVLIFGLGMGLLSCEWEVCGEKSGGFVAVGGVVVGFWAVRRLVGWVVGESGFVVGGRGGWWTVFAVWEVMGVVFVVGVMGCWVLEGGGVGAVQVVGLGFGGISVRLCFGGGGRVSGGGGVVGGCWCGSVVGVGGFGGWGCGRCGGAGGVLFGESWEVMLGVVGVGVVGVVVERERLMLYGGVGGLVMWGWGSVGGGGSSVRVLWLVGSGFGCVWWSLAGGLGEVLLSGYGGVWEGEGVRTMEWVRGSRVGGGFGDWLVTLVYLGRWFWLVWGSWVRVAVVVAISCGGLGGVGAVRVLGLVAWWVFVCWREYAVSGCWVLGVVGWEGGFGVEGYQSSGMLRLGLLGGFSMGLVVGVGLECVGFG
ncbi:hypothetical protein Tco_0841120 [Tanacetum coccineum]|uniref:Uncharacterized protein n=1 Tax=Tanacetum coccineum TaxID=301880 RepID=A0ABQ5AZ00_9ASTR